MRCSKTTTLQHWALMTANKDPGGGATTTVFREQIVLRRAAVRRAAPDVLCHMNSLSLVLIKPLYEKYKTVF